MALYKFILSFNENRYKFIRIGIIQNNIHNTSQIQIFSTQYTRKTFNIILIFDISVGIHHRSFVPSIDECFLTKEALLRASLIFLINSTLRRHFGNCDEAVRSVGKVGKWKKGTSDGAGGGRDRLFVFIRCRAK